MLSEWHTPGRPESATTKTKSSSSALVTLVGRMLAMLLLLLPFHMLLHTASAEGPSPGVSAFECAGVPDAVANAQDWPATCINAWAGSTCEAACLPGYVGEPISVCEGSKWGPITGTCDPHRSVGAVVASAIAPASSAGLGGAAATSAWAGAFYYPFGTCHRTAHCLEYPSTTNLTNARYLTWTDTYCSFWDAGVCYMSCKPDYVGLYMAQCKQSQWSSTWGSCVKDRNCRGMPSSVGVNNTIYTWQQLLSSVTYDGYSSVLWCNYPYVGGYVAQCKQGNFTVYGTCRANINSARTCSGSSLPSLSQTPNAAAAWSCDGTSAYSNGYFCELRCMSGFIGSYFTWCNVTSNSAAWTRPVGSCFPDSSCSSSPPVNISTPNGSGVWDRTAPVAAGTVSQMQCADGFIGAYLTMCTAGRWSTPVGSCWKDTKVCAPPSFNNSFANATGTWDCGTYFGDGARCTMSCTQGQKGAYYTWCKSGQWTFPSGSCYPDTNYCLDPPQVTYANATGVWNCQSSTKPYNNGYGCSMSCSAGYLGGYWTWCKFGQWLPVTGTCYKDTSTCPDLVSDARLQNAPFNGDGTWNCEGFSRGSLCRMNCKTPNVGVPFSGGLFTWCLDGQWSTASGSCRQFTSSNPARDCLLPQSFVDRAPANAEYGSWADVCSGSLSDGGYCRMYCASGYVGSYIVQCQLGNFSAVMGSCVVDKRCRRPPDSSALQQAAYQTWDSYWCTTREDGAVCTMGCRPRYVGGYAVQCRQGNWSAVMGSCHGDNRCYGYPTSDATGLSNGVYSDWADVCYGNTPDGNFCEMLCNPNYLGSYLAVCKQGTWLGLTGCVGSPSNPVNGSYACGQSSPPGTICTANCSSGYRGSPIPTATCLSNGTWAASGRCIQIVCSNSPSNPANGTFNCGTRSLPNTVCQANCSVGFAGSPNATCLANGTWSRVSGGCSLIVCKGSPANPANGTFSCGNSTLPGSACVSICSTGFTGTPTAVCLASGTWDSVQGNCSRILCSGSPQNPSNATFNCTSSTLPGEVCSGSCNSGFTGTATAICLANGTWGVSSNCSRIVCAANPVNPANGTFNCGPSTFSGGVCIANCSTGYIGAPNATCLANGTWSNVNGVCTRVCMGSPANPVGGTYFCAPFTVVNGVCLGNCSAAYNGTLSATCRSTGLWASSGTCTIAACLGNPANVTAGVFNCGIKTRLNAICSANCTTGFVGAPNATCLSNGTWSGVAGNCTKSPGR